MGLGPQFQRRQKGLSHVGFYFSLPIQLHDRMNVALGNESPGSIMFLPSLGNQKCLPLIASKRHSESASSPGVRSPSSLASESPRGLESKWDEVRPENPWWLIFPDLASEDLPSLALSSRPTLRHARSKDVRPEALLGAAH